MTNKVNNVTEALQAVLDMATGVDGGISFVKLKFMLESVEKQAQSGDRDAQEIIRMVKGFANLVRYAENS
jgi:hypothetical protein